MKKDLLTRACAFLLAVLMAGACPCPAQEKKDDLSLSAADYSFLLEVARRAAGTILKDDSIEPPPPLPQGEEAKEGAKTVYVSLFADGALVASARGDRETITEAAKVAGTRVGGRLKVTEHGQALLDRGRIKIDVITETDLLQRSVITRYMEVLDPGVEGIAVKTERGTMHMLPTTLLFAGQEAETQIQGILTIADRTSVGAKPPEVRKIKAVTFMESEPGKEAVKLFRGNVLLDAATPDDMEKAALRAGLWLLSVQSKSGRFKYRSDPVLVYQDPTYNMVRHAGTCWGLFWLYRSTGDDQFLKAMQKGLEYLQQHTERSAEPQKFAHVRFAEKSPLGATALTLLTMAEATLSGVIQADKETMEDYANFIVFMQHSSGEFHKDLSDALKRGPVQEEPMYFPGEAVYALLQYHKLNPNKKWLEVAEKAMDVQIARFQREDFPDQWVMMALQELSQITKKPEYSKACLGMADSILAKQHKPGDVPDPDYIGGFNHTNPPETCSAATRIEGLVAAWRLSEKAGSTGKGYADAIHLAAKFLMQQQFRPVNSYMANPTVPFAGGFHASPTNFELRIDYAQHAISALIGAAEVARAGK